MDILNLGINLPWLFTPEGRLVIKTLNSKEYRDHDGELSKYHMHIFCHDKDNYTTHYNSDKDLPVDINQIGTYYQINKIAVLKALQFGGTNTVLSITAQQHSKLIRILKTENYFNNVCFHSTLKSTYAPNINHGLVTINCNLYNRKNFKIPTLKKITLIFLHRHTCFSQQYNYVKSSADFSPQFYVFQTLHIPETLRDQLLTLTVFCRLHKGQVHANANTAMSSHRFYVRNNSAAQTLLIKYAIQHPLLQRYKNDNASIISGKHLLTKKEVNILWDICINQSKLINCDLPNRSIDSFGLIENYDNYSSDYYDYVSNIVDL
jgi:hypothetical protein